MDWFNKANLGIFIHWGIYAVPAYDDTNSARYRKIGNGSEWYYKRLTNTHRESISDKKTKIYHAKNYGNANYYDFMSKFTGKDFDADKWCTYFASIGAKYIVITAKHHDGFCLWDTKTTEHNIMNTPLKRDILAELRKAATEHKLRFGIYYSWLEFDRYISKKYINEHVMPQLTELESYKPDLWWMDGDWTATSEQLDAKSFVDRVHKSGAIINSRLGKDKAVSGDYNNFSDRFIPNERLEERFESCCTIGLSWGYNKQQTRTDYKTPEQLFDIYTAVTSNNGNLLLNIAPDKEGNFDKSEEQSLTKFGELIKQPKIEKPIDETH
jgi:alpha-L-fucosidase